MSERVSQFLIRLSQDPVLLDAFLSDPDPLLRQSDLTAEEGDVLRSGDADRIRRLLGDDVWWAAPTSTEPDGQPGPPPHPKPPGKPKPPKPAN